MLGPWLVHIIQGAFGMLVKVYPVRKTGDVGSQPHFMQVRGQIRLMTLEIVPHTNTIFPQLHNQSFKVGHRTLNPNLKHKQKPTASEPYIQPVNPV